MRFDYTRIVKSIRSMVESSRALFDSTAKKRILPMAIRAVEASRTFFQSVVAHPAVVAAGRKVRPCLDYLDAVIRDRIMPLADRMIALACVYWTSFSKTRLGSPIVRFVHSSTTLFGSSLKTRIVSFVSLFLAMCAFGAAAVVPMEADAPGQSDIPVRSVAEEIQLPSLAEQIASLENQKHFFIREERVRLGDTLGSLMTRLGVSDAAAMAFIKSDSTARGILQLKAGKIVQAKTDESGVLYWLSMSASENKDGPVREIVVSRAASGFTASNTESELERRIEMRTGYINSSLFAATDAAQIPDSVTGKFVDMFSTNVDFRSDLRRGDHFNLVYETFWQNGTLVRSGRILAAEFVNGGKTYQAIWFDDPNSDQGGGYYSFDGKSLKKAFLKSPLEFTRISSGFSMRVHPLTGAWKQHKGIDFAAPTGTPIRAAADGTIDFIGRRGGYGNFIIVKHWNPYSTAYGHMSRFASGMRSGTKVRQGDVIGYVGTTGWSTGPHLHYEFRVHDAQQNPLNMDMPNARPLTTAELQKFRAVAADMEHRFALMNPDSEKVAASE